MYLLFFLPLVLPLKFDRVVFYRVYVISVYTISSSLIFFLTFFQFLLLFWFGFNFFYTFSVIHPPVSNIWKIKHDVDFVCTKLIDNIEKNKKRTNREKYWTKGMILPLITLMEDEPPNTWRTNSSTSRYKSQK